MNFLIVTHVAHSINDKNQPGGYSPYVREMNLWGKYVDKITIVAPISKDPLTPMDLLYNHPNISMVPVKDIDFTSIPAIIKSAFRLPGIMWIIFRQMQKADHIHLRCPGNMGMLACFIQVLFPKKKKTAKYAGNWDPAYKNPVSYSLQKTILANTFLTRNMSVLVYGSWPGFTKNTKSFYTATYFSDEIDRQFKKSYSGRPVFVFSGVMDGRKDPFFTYELFKAIKQVLPTAVLHFCGDGSLKLPLQEKVKEEGFSDSIIFEGALSKDQMKKVYQQAHFLIFFTKTSEGWPKAVAESLFWGVIPVTKPISVVTQMVDNGNRGLLFDKVEIQSIVKKVQALWNDKSRIEKMSEDAMKWSRQYTLDGFENEIKKLILS